MKKITLIIALSIFSIARANALKVKGQVVDETSLVGWCIYIIFKQIGVFRY